VPHAAGQFAIHLRDALSAGDPDRAAALVCHLDQAHRIEVLLGAALRDGRDRFRAASMYLEASARPVTAEAWLPLCVRLAGPVNPTWDEIAAGWVVRHRLGEPRDHGSGPGPTSATPEAWVAAIRAGAGLDELLARSRHHLLCPAVSAYYRGKIRAMGWRPALLLVLVQ